MDFVPFVSHAAQETFKSSIVYRIYRIYCDIQPFCELIIISLIVLLDFTDETGEDLQILCFFACILLNYVCQIMMYPVFFSSFRPEIRERTFLTTEKRLEFKSFNECIYWSRVVLFGLVTRMLE